MHLVDKNVGDVTQSGVLLEHPQQHTSSAEEQRGVTVLPALAAHRVTDCALPQHLASLRSDAIGDANRGDAARLGDDHGDWLAAPARLL